MKTIKKQQTVKMNLTLSKEVYQMLQKNAKGDFVKVATYAKQLLMRSLYEKNKSEEKRLTKNETTMDN